MVISCGESYRKKVIGRHYAFTESGQLTLSLKSGDRVTQTLTWERAK
jgi:hypothetical protein